jgi:hypothetical protein
MVSSHFPDSTTNRVTHQLYSVLPKLGLPGLVEKGERSHMVNEQVAQNGQLGILWRHFSLVAPEGCAKAAERSG